MNDTVDFFNTFLFHDNNDDNDTDNNHQDNVEIDRTNVEVNINNLSPLDKWKRIDSYMDYGSNNADSQRHKRKTKANGQQTPQKTTWDEIRTRYKFA